MKVQQLSGHMKLEPGNLAFSKTSSRRGLNQTRALGHADMQTPQTQTLYDIFSDARIRYIVPVYQRAYVWKREENWEPLWEDISRVLERYLDDPHERPAPTHFLGALVLEQQRAAPGQVDERVIIDGQQRLTTLQALLAAARLVVRDRDEDVARELGELTLNRAKTASGDLRFKVWPSKSDRAPFKSIIDPELSPSPSSQGIPGAYAYFVEAIRAWLAEDDPHSHGTERHVQALQHCLSDLLYFVTINLDDSDNAQVIFETLNARGTDLTALDLVKNIVFLLAERSREDVDALYEDYWMPTFEADDYWRQEERQGRETRPRADWFLMHWLAMELGRVVGTSSLFDTFRRDVLRATPAPSMKSLVPRLCEDARIMRGFRDYPQSTPERLFFDRLAAMDTTTLYPLALLLFRSPRVTESVRRRALGAVESWLVRRAILRLTSKNYNRLLASMIARVKADLEHADAAVVTELRASDAETAVWPSDETLRDRLQFREVYGFIGQARLRMLLEACEQDLRAGAKTEKVSLPEGLSIEHAMPQSWREHWQRPAGDDQGEAGKQRDAHLHRLGNLTLVTAPLNSSLGNAPWTIATALSPEKTKSEKRAELKNHSVLLLNQRLISHDVWDEAQIDERGKDLAERIIRTWPGPVAENWPGVDSSGR